VAVSGVLRRFSDCKKTPILRGAASFLHQAFTAGADCPAQIARSRVIGELPKKYCRISMARRFEKLKEILFFQENLNIVGALG